MSNDPDLPSIDELVATRQPLHSGLQSVQQASRAVFEKDNPLEEVDDAIDYLNRTFLAMCRAEEFVLFPSIDGILGRVGATDVLTAQHESLRAMTADLEKVRARLAETGNVEGLRQPLLALLHGLYAVVRVHIEAEDDAYLPLVQQYLSESQVETIVENLGRLSRSVASGEAPVGPQT